MDIIPVVYSTNSKYFNLLYVSLFSLISNTSSNLDIYILYSKLSKKKINLLNKLKSNNIKINLININNYLINNNFYISSYITKEAYFRLYIGKIINYSKIIYLDTDTIINFDIKELYNINLNNKVLGCVLDYNIKLDKNYYNYLKELGINNYFNSGVLLINNDLYLKTDEEIKEAFSILNKYKLKYHDQDILNIYYKEKTLILSKKYNYNIDLCSNSNIKVIKGIIHFNGPRKPTNNYKNKNDYIFYKYAKNTIVYKDIVRKKLIYKYFIRYIKFIKRKLYD